MTVFHAGNSFSQTPKDITPAAPEPKPVIVTKVSIHEFGNGTALICGAHSWDQKFQQSYFVEIPEPMGPGINILMRENKTKVITITHKKAYSFHTSSLKFKNIEGKVIDPEKALVSIEKHKAFLVVENEEAEIAQKLFNLYDGELIQVIPDSSNTPRHAAP